jgi:hypothetical protein
MLSVAPKKDSAARGTNGAEDRPGGRGLSRTAFADEPEDLSLHKRQVHIVNGAHRADGFGNHPWLRTGKYLHSP